MRIMFLAFILSSATSVVHAADAGCPSIPGTVLARVDVYDGPFEDNAVLVPDVNKSTRAIWNVTSVYNGKRIVNVVCHYANGNTQRRSFASRVRSCELLTPAKGGPTFTCR